MASFIEGAEGSQTVLFPEQLEDWINECQTCPLQSRCATGRERRITRWEHEHLIDAMRERPSGDTDPTTLRRCTSNTPSARSRHGWGIPIS